MFKNRLCAEIQVLDTGIGIQKGELDKITNEFFQIQQSDESKSNPQGLGLGLSIVQRVSSLLGAPLRFESEFGKGSLFSIMLPATFDAQEPESVAAESVKSEPSSSLKGMTVLCLDNDDSVLKSLVNVLEDWDCDVLAANNYDQAAEFMSVDVDIILADYHLGGELTGLDFLQEFFVVKPDMKCVLITAAQDASVQDTADRYGFSYLRKPLDIEKLNHLLISPK